MNKLLVSKVNLNGGVLNEMSRINMRESNIYPFNKFEVIICSREHEPPHFHIKSEGWNISFLISDGNKYKVHNKGEKKSVGDYIINNAELWLNSRNAILEAVTNREYAAAIWESLHGINE